MATIVVAELFVSIQGESTAAGRVCAFVRTAGCPLSCRWCDTAYARRGGRQMEVGEVIEWVESEGVGLVCVTGGEPLIQPGAVELVQVLVGEGFEVWVETSGAVDIGPVAGVGRVVMDIKCPGSGMSGRMRWENLGLLRPGDEIKFVVADRGDYEFAKQVVATRQLPEGVEVLLSPVWGELSPRELAEWMVAERFPGRLQLQLHKYIWGPQARGV